MRKNKWNKPKCQESILDTLKICNALSMHQLAHVIGVSYQTVRDTLHRMHEAEPKAVYISEWKVVDKCHTVPLFSIGALPDALKPEPKKKRSTEDARRWRSNKQKCGEEEVEVQLEFELARKAREALARPIFRHPLDVALFGEYRRRAA
jgi:hypothetical protein